GQSEIARASRCFTCGLIAALILFAGGASICWGDEARPDMQEQMRFFESEIRPILASRCVECHGSESQESGLRLDRRQAALEGGDRGAAWVPHQPKESLLIQ